MPSVVKFYLRASVALPLIKLFLVTSAALRCVIRSCGGPASRPLACLSVPARYSLLSLPPTRHPYGVEPRA